MSRRSFLLTLATGLLFLGGAGTLLYYLVRYEKTWYGAAAVDAGPTREQRAQEFYTEFCELISTFGADREWYAQFTEEQINSYLAEDFVKTGLDARSLPEGISEPRVAFEQDVIRLGFRYGSGIWSTIITVDLRVWLPSGEPNVMALELVGLHAGALPIKAQSLLERVAQVGRDSGIEVSWYRHKGHPVAILRFQADQPRATMKLQAVKVDPGSIMIRGSVPDGTPPTHAAIAVPVAGQKPSAN